MRQHVTATGGHVVEPEVGDERQRAWRTIQHDVSIECALAAQREPWGKLVDNVSGEARDGEVGATHQERAFRAARRYACDACAANKRGASKGEVGVGYVEVGGIAMQVHGIAHAATSLRRQSRIEPAEVRDGNGCAREVEPEAAPVKADGAISGHDGQRQFHVCPAPPERVLRYEQRPRQRPHVDDWRPIRFTDHRQRGNHHGRGAGIMCDGHRGERRIEVMVVEHALKPAGYTLHAAACCFLQRCRHRGVARGSTQRGIRRPRTAIEQASVPDDDVRQLRWRRMFRRILWRAARPQE